jgi:hypothetical protein
MINAFANIIAAVHIIYFLFVVGGLAAILIGPQRRWEWVGNVWFRLLHMVAVYVVVFEDVVHVQCPLNSAEWQLRSGTSSAIEATSGIGGVLDYLLRHTIPGSVLHVFYWCAAVFVAVSLFSELRRKHLI